MTGFLRLEKPVAARAPGSNQLSYAVSHAVGDHVRIDGDGGVVGTVTCISISFGISYEVSWWNGGEERRTWFAAERLGVVR